MIKGKNLMITALFILIGAMVFMGSASGLRIDEIGDRTSANNLNITTIALGKIDVFNNTGNFSNYTVWADDGSTNTSICTATEAQIVSGGGAVNITCDFIGTVADGSYTVYVEGNRSSVGSTNTTKYTSIGIDDTKPAGTLTCSPSTLTIGSSTTCTMVCTDSGFGTNGCLSATTTDDNNAVNSMAESSTADTFTYSFTPVNLGIQTVAGSVTDQHGFSATTSASITISSSNGFVPKLGGVSGVTLGIFGVDTSSTGFALALIPKSTKRIGLSILGIVVILLIFKAVSIVSILAVVAWILAVMFVFVK